MTASRPVVGIDIGGTMVKLGLVDAAGTVLARATLPFRDQTSFAALVEALAEAIAGLGGQPAAVGIASPGWVDPEAGRLAVGGQNVPVLHGRQLGAALSDRLGLPARQINDGTAAALGELHLAAGAACDASPSSRSAPAWAAPW